jgi:hypothetical protein
MPGGVVAGVHVDKPFIIRDTTLTAVPAFDLFLSARLVVNSLVPSIPTTVQNRYVPIVHQSWALLGEPGLPSDNP